jgi:hypothetical protein
VVAQRYKRDVALSSSNDLYSTSIITVDERCRRPGFPPSEVTSMSLCYDYIPRTDLDSDKIKRQSQESSLAG